MPEVTPGSAALTKADAANKATREGCPNRAEHVTGEPDGYLQWHAWAERMSKTHKQRKCPGCKLWLIWEAR